jgi:ribosome biogenesis GTPase A
MPPALRELTSQSTWLLDTPGVTLPHRLETEQGLKLALSGCIADHAIPDTYLTIGEYLYYVVTEQPFRHSPVKRDSSIIGPRQSFTT